MPKWLVWFEAIEVDAETDEDAIASAKLKLGEKLRDGTLDIEDITMDASISLEIDEAEIIRLEEGKHDNEV